MNLILFEPHELDTPLIWSDPRSEHVTQILHMGVGDEFAAGVIEGPIGKARITSMHEGMMSLAFEWGETPPPLPPLTLIVGLPRPPTARKVLNEVTSLGVGAMHFVLTELGEKNYAQSPLWSSGEWRRHVINGAQQAVDTHLPEVTYARRLSEVIASLPPGRRPHRPRQLRSVPSPARRPVAAARSHRHRPGARLVAPRAANAT